MIMRQFIPLLVFVLTANAVSAGQTEHLDCPPPMEFSSRKADLMAELKETRSSADGLYLTRYLVAIFTTAPNRRAQEMLNEGIMHRQVRDFTAAGAALDELISYCPAFAEGYHQRAMLHRAEGNSEAALADLDRALERAPDHIGALARKAQVLVDLGRYDEGREVQRSVLALNPWMPDRFVTLDIPGEAL